ncbi:uncharacterized protein NPIL_237771 [Nephila pilipes]|uniref:Uncharacterized protein n=1 Tax=Nephila pilipes TaxID=299642 RepID=A0A8X6UC34_NEPPI|nr:uncharacterized protein NPIL_237771 [Nephila pilipes]
MFPRFWPFLQLMAQVGVAKGILRNFEFRNVLPDFLCEDGFTDLLSLHQILSSLHLPHDIKNCTMGIIEALGKEISNWCYCHCVFFIDADLDYWHRIQWYSHGTINRLETARAFIRDENISIGHRFNLACAYYLEADVRTLFQNMSLSYRKYFSVRKVEYRSRMFWLDALQTNTSFNWLEISLAVLTDNFSIHNSCNFFHKNCLGLLHAFPKLVNTKARIRSILSSLGSKELHAFDLYLCLSKMEDRHLDNLFDRLSTEQQISVCMSFLHWPLQGLFLDVLELIRRNLTEDFYLELFGIILYENFNTKWFDYDYVDLVKQIWSSLSDYIKSRIGQNRIFPCLKQVLNHDEQ